MLGKSEFEELEFVCMYVSGANDDLNRRIKV